MDTKKQNGQFLVFPMAIGNLVFYSIPFVWIIYVSFTFGLDRLWVGLDNYKELISNPTFQLAAVNTFKYIIVSIPLLLMSSLLTALLVQRLGRAGLLLLFALLLPMVMPSSAVSAIANVLFAEDGAINRCIESIGLAPVLWLDSKALFSVFVCVYLWRNIGCASLMFFLALSSIPKTYYNTAKIDGANSFRRFLNITLPQLGPAFFLTSLISFMRLFDSFRDMLLMCGTYPNKSAYMLQHFIYNNFRSLNLSRLSTASLLLFLPIFIAALYLSSSNQKMIALKGFLQINPNTTLETRRINPALYLPTLVLISAALFPFAYFLINSVKEWGIFFTEQYAYLSRFVNSMLLALAILAGNTCIACAAGFSLAKLRFRGRAVFYFIMILTALLPLQVMLTPNYLVLNKLNLLDTYWALILPQLFMPRSVFLMTLVFSNISNNILQTAMLDGTGVVNMLRRIALPNSKFGLISVAMLSFIDAWNMIEQPMSFLKTPSKYPLVVYLSTTELSEVIGLNTVFNAVTVLAMIPAVVFLLLSARLFSKEFK